MSIYEYNEEAHMKVLQEDSYADGLAEGHKNGLAEGHENGLAEGHAKTLVNLVTSAMKRLKGTVAEACDFLEIPEADYFAAKKLLDEQQTNAVGSTTSGEPAHSKIPVTGV